MCKPLFLYVAMFLVFGLSFTLAAENQEPDDSGEDERLIFSLRAHADLFRFEIPYSVYLENSE